MVLIRVGVVWHHMRVGVHIWWIDYLTRWILHLTWNPRHLHHGCSGIMLGRSVWYLSTDLSSVIGPPLFLRRLLIWTTRTGLLDLSLLRMMGLLRGLSLLLGLLKRMWRSVGDWVARTHHDLTGREAGNNRRLIGWKLMWLINGLRKGSINLKFCLFRVHI